MFKIRAAVAMVMLAGPALWAIASLTPDAGPREAGVIRASQVEPFALMSGTRHLPAQAYEAY